MITAETVNGIVTFQANGLPVVSLYCRVDPGKGYADGHARWIRLWPVYRHLTGPDPLGRGKAAECRRSETLAGRGCGLARPPATVES